MGQMKIHRLILLGTALVTAPLAMAKLPFTNDALGKVEGTLDFCAQTDSQSAAKYQERKKAMVQGVSEQELAEARASQEYKDAYESTSSELEKVPKEKVVAACTAFLKGDK
jgi:ABC-type taurine transport system substrate-binding protein